MELGILSPEFELDANEQLVINCVIELREKGKSRREISDAVSVGSIKVSNVTVKRILQNQSEYC